MVVAASAAWFRQRVLHGSGSESCTVKAASAAWFRQRVLHGSGNECCMV